MSEFSRREFISTVSGAVLLNTVLPQHGFSKTYSHADSLKVKFYCPRWGADDSWDSFCKRVKSAGYDGIEVALSLESKDQPELLAAIQKHNLELILLAIPGSSEVEEHKKQLNKILRHFVTLKPVLINTHTGRDFFTFEQNQQIIQVADKVAKETGAKILHETHRGKFSFAAQATKSFLEKMPDLRLTLDISHWCNVSESLLENQKEAVELALSRTDHIHSRVGHAEGPQVNDPRAPEWDREVKAHLAWWDTVLELHRKKGTKELTITTEFGPATYLPALPYTKQPVASQWDINVHMMQLLKKRYNTA